MSMLVVKVLAAACVMSCTLANGQLFLNQYPIEVSATVAHLSGGVDAEMIIRAPFGILFGNQYELVLRLRSGAVHFSALLVSFPFQLTNQQFRVYNLRNLFQDEYYTIQIQIRNIVTGIIQPSSDPFTLLTTGLQRITAEVGSEGESATVTCHFLMGARADGCLVQLRAVSSTLGSDRLLQISRAANSLVATGTFAGLQENSTYTVQAFGTRAGVNLHADLPIVLPSNLTLGRSTVDGQTQTVTTSTAPSLSTGTSVSSAPSVSTTPTTEPSSSPVTLFLVTIVPAVTVGAVALGVAIIVTCACMHTKMRKCRPAQNDISSNRKMPYTRHSNPAHSNPTHSNRTQIQQNGSNTDNIAPDVYPHGHDYIVVLPSSPVYAVADGDAECCRSSRTASGGEYMYVDKRISFHPSNSSPGVDEIIVTDNYAYSVPLTQSPTGHLPLEKENSN